jgi:hypothetical protein
MIALPAKAAVAAVGGDGWAVAGMTAPRGIIFRYRVAHLPSAGLQSAASPLITMGIALADTGTADPRQRNPGRTQRYQPIG